MSIPPAAIERFRKLEGWADEAGASHLAGYEAVTDLRDRLGKMELAVHRHGRDHRLAVEPDGSVSVAVGRQLPPQDRGDGDFQTWSAPRAPFTDELGGRVGAVAAATREAQEIVRVRGQLARTEARNRALSARAATFGELARACREELAARGWSDGGDVTTGPRLIGVDLPRVSSAPGPAPTTPGAAA